MVYEKQLKVGFHEGASILFSTISSTYTLTIDPTMSSKIPDTNL